MRLAHEIEGAVVAGGGPAGAAAALLLARAGRPVTIIERHAAPAHKVCGEFIGGDALAILGSLGIDVASLGARPISRLRLLRDRRMVEAALPFAAIGLSRRALDSALLGAAESCGATVLRGHAIRRIRATTLAVERLGTINATHLLLATGKHDVRGAERQRVRSARDTVGFKLHLRLAPEQLRDLDGAIELLLIGDAYVGLQAVEGGMANLCLVAQAARLRAACGWQGLLSTLSRASPLLAARLAGARGWPTPLSVARVPYGFVHRPGEDTDTAFRLGDQMGVIPSFAGDGVAIALRTAQLAATCLLAGGTARDYHARARADIAGPIRLACMLDRARLYGPAQRALLALARLWPGVLGQIAGALRVG